MHVVGEWFSQAMAETATLTTCRSHTSGYSSTLAGVSDVKFASGIRNINFGFTHTPMCVSTIYSVLPESCEKISQAC